MLRYGYIWRFYKVRSGRWEFNVMMASVDVWYDLRYSSTGFIFLSVYGHQISAALVVSLVFCKLRSGRWKSVVAMVTAGTGKILPERIETLTRSPSSV